MLGDLGTPVTNFGSGPKCGVIWGLCQYLLVSAGVLLTSALNGFLHMCILSQTFFRRRRALVESGLRSV